MKQFKLGKSRLVLIRKVLLKRLGLEHAAAVLVDRSADDSIALRLAAAYPIEIYGDGRVREFDEADRMTRREATRVAAAACKRR